MTAPWVIHIVDDDEPVRTSLKFALEAAGFEVASFHDAGDFLARGRKRRGLMICDVRMPGMNGIDLTRLLKQEGSTMPIILLTGHASKALQADAISAGADAVLEKPIELGALVAEIERLSVDRF
jgi:two-component system response regulator FixJ